MKVHVKPIGLLASAGIFLSTLIGPTAQAQTVIVAQDTGILNASGGVSQSSEQLQVYYSVLFTDQTGLYTYDYNVYNPLGDVELPGAPNPGSPETVSGFQLSFDTTMPGAVVSLTAPTPGSAQNNGTGGLAWSFPSVPPGAESPLLAFQSDLPPIPGNASASGGAIPPSPWVGIVDVAVPHPSPEPETTTLLALSASFFLPSIRRFFRRG